MRPTPLRSSIAIAILASTLGCGDQVVGGFGTIAASDGVASEEPPPAPEICDGIDNDLDGLVDEVALGVSECQGCQLLQGEGQAWWICGAEMLTFAAAQDRCEGLGATLAIVPNAASQAFLHTEVGQGFWWLGAQQAQGEGAWSWVDGTPLGYTNWGGTQPDDVSPGQDCLRLTFGITDNGWFDGAWDDFFCDDVHPLMCSALHITL